MTVRPIEPRDYPALETFLYHAVFVPPAHTPPPREVVNLPEIAVYINGFGKRGDCGVVADEGGKLVGAAWARKIRAFGYIDNDTPELAVSVLPAYRGQCVGSAMLAALHEELRRRGHKRVSLSVQKQNPAMRLYARLGYEAFREHGGDVIMIKQLQKTLPFGGQSWLVLDERGGAALLLRETCLPERAYRAQNAPTTWSTCDVREWLNGEFYAAFNNADKSRVIQTAVSTAPNPRLGTPGGEETRDCAFLLSVEEIVSYFGDSGQPANGSPTSKYWVNDGYNAARIAKNDAGEAAWWWTRSPGMHANTAVYVNTGGSFNLAGHRVWNGGGGIRPAMWVAL